MNIYNAEKTIAHLIQDKKNNRVFTSPSIANLSLITDKQKDVIANVVDEKHPDLLYGSAILVSTVMNRNDDVFAPDTTWSARKTALDQPFNDDHVAEDIVGHIINVRALDANKEELDFNAEVAPDFFHLEIDFVVYQSIFPDIATEIAEEGPKQNKFVSMEARVSDFDYALFDPITKSMQIMKRNEETAWMTKYLRVYGGEGTYNKYRIGRVLRDMRFVGVGNVDVPANPDSVYTIINNNAIVDIIAKAKENQMDSKELINELKEQVKALKLDNEKFASAKTQETIDELTASVKDLTDKSEGDSQKLSIAETKIEELETELSTSKEAKETLIKELEAKVKELDGINAEKTMVERMKQMTEAGIQVTSDEQKERIAKMSDEIFADVLQFAKKTDVKPEDKEKSVADEDTTEPDPKETEADIKNDLDEGVESKKNDDGAETLNNAKPDESLVETAKILASGLIANVTKENK